MLHLLALKQVCPICKKALKQQPKPNLSLKTLANLKLKAMRKVRGLSMHTSQPNLTDKRLEKLNLTCQTDGKFYNMCISVPQSEKRRPVAIVCILDVSGSMNSVVGQAEGGKGFTRLDLVKHVMNVIVTALDKDDYLSIIKFSDESELVMDLAPMNDENKIIAKNYISDLAVMGCTSTGPAIKMAYDVIENGPQNYINSILLLTDGVDSDGEEYLRSTYDSIQHSRPVQFSTFGFSNDIWSHLLQELALKGGGIFGYIPDQTMIGTVLINFLANTLLTYEQAIYVEVDDAYEFVMENHPKKIAFYYGQNRNFLLRKKRQYTDTLPVLKLGKSRVSMHEFKAENVHQADLSKQIARNKLVEFSFNRDLPRVLAKDYEDSPLLNITEFVTEFKQLDDQERNDNYQQLKLSLVYWDKWGAHYVRSFVFSHLFEQCLNFKSPSMQIYRIEKFDQLVDELTDLFCNLAPPPPTGFIYSSSNTNYQAISMNGLMNSHGGCILETCRVKLDSNKWKQIGDLMKNDVLSNGAKVVCLIKSLYNGPLVRIGKLVLTAFHPVFYDNKWQFPINLLLNSISNNDDYNNNNIISVIQPAIPVYVCNVVLDQYHMIEIEGYNCITLAHGFQNYVLKHPYYGTQMCLKDLSVLKGWREGMICIKDYSLQRDENGLVCGTLVHEYDE